MGGNMGVDEDNADCTAAICKCGRIVMVVVTDSSAMNRKTKNELGRMAAEGYNIKHMTVKEARQMPFFCECKKGG
jgi:hypothetical protein